MLDLKWLANELWPWTPKNAILPAASSLVALAESNPDSFSHRYCLPDVISFPVRFRRPAIPQLVSFFSGAVAEARQQPRFFPKSSALHSVRVWIFRPAAQARGEQGANTRPGVARRRHYFVCSGVPPVLHPDAQFSVGRHHSEHLGRRGGLPLVQSVGRNNVEAPVRLGREDRVLDVLAAGLYLPPRLPWFIHHLIDSLAERDSPEQLGHCRSHVCRERWDSAARVERADRKAPSVEPCSLR